MNQDQQPQGFDQNQYAQPQQQSFSQNQYAQPQQQGFYQNQYAQPQQQGFGQNQYAEPQQQSFGQNQYAQPQQQGYYPNSTQAARPVKPPKTKGIFETSLPLLIVSVIVPSIILRIVQIVVPLIANEIYHLTYSEFLFNASSLIYSLVNIIATCLFTFLLCKPKRDGFMLLGLLFLFGSASNIFIDFFGFFDRIVNSSLYLTLINIFSFVNLAAVVAVMVLLSVGVKKPERPEQETELHSAGRGVLIAVSVSVTLLCYLLPFLLSKISSIDGYTLNIICIALEIIPLLIFCIVKFKNISETLAFFGIFKVAEYAKNILSGVASIGYSEGFLSVSMYTTVSNIAIIVASIIIQVVLILLLTKKKDPRQAVPQAYTQAF